MQNNDQPQGTQDGDGVRWLALLLRQACLLVAAAVEARYGLKRRASGQW
jgi:hypothetical protein